MISEQYAAKICELNDELEMENEQLRNTLRFLAKDYDKLHTEIDQLQRYITERDHYRHQWTEGQAENDRLQEALRRIEEWSRAYPLSVFPEPDLAKARALLEAGGMTLDAISAHAMRHVVDGVGKIARETQR